MSIFCNADCPPEVTRMAWVKRNTGWDEAVERVGQQFAPNLRIEGLHIDAPAILREIADLFHQRPPIYWQSQPPGAVYGLSLTCNPDTPASDWHAGSFGHPRYQQYSSFDYFKAPEADSASAPRDDYLDSLGFRSLLPEIRGLPALRGLLESFRMPVVRCTVRVIDGNKAWPSRDDGGGMHRDDPPFEVMRVNVCITGSDDFGLQYSGQPPLVLSPGDHLVVNTDVDHRAWVRQRSNIQRVHLVIGLLPWLNYDQTADAWEVNEHFGKTHPYDLVRRNLVLRT